MQNKSPEIFLLNPQQRGSNQSNQSNFFCYMISKMLLILLKSNKNKMAKYLQ